MTKFSGIATLAVGLPVVAITACSSPQHASTQTGHHPPVEELCTGVVG